MKDRDGSERRVIAASGVPRSSLRDRRDGALPKRVWDSKSKKPSKLSRGGGSGPRDIQSCLKRNKRYKIYSAKYSQQSTWRAK